MGAPTGERSRSASSKDASGRTSSWARFPPQCAGESRKTRVVPGAIRRFWGDEDRTSGRDGGGARRHRAESRNQRGVPALAEAVPPSTRRRAADGFRARETLFHVFADELGHLEHADLLLAA